jgi:hypothetical protein
MSAYRESGERAVTIEAHRRAFVMIYQVPYEVLGFAPTDETRRIVELREDPDLYEVDRGLVALFESQTQNLRLLDRLLDTDPRPS